MDSAIISDPYRQPIVAQQKDGGGIILRGPGAPLILSQAEVERLVDFANGLGRIQVFHADRYE
jgi:hypothetical protein